MSGMLMPEYWAEGELSEPNAYSIPNGRSLIGWLIGTKAGSPEQRSSADRIGKKAAAEGYLADLW